MRKTFFCSELTAEEVMAQRHAYRPQHYYEQDPELRQAINQLLEGHFSPDNPHSFTRLCALCSMWIGSLCLPISHRTLPVRTGVGYISR